MLLCWCNDECLGALGNFPDFSLIPRLGTLHGCYWRISASIDTRINNDLSRRFSKYFHSFIIHKLTKCGQTPLFIIFEHLFCLFQFFIT